MNQVQKKMFKEYIKSFPFVNKVKIEKDKVTYYLDSEYVCDISDVADDELKKLTPKKIKQKKEFWKKFKAAKNVS